MYRLGLALLLLLCACGRDASPLQSDAGRPPPGAPQDVVHDLQAAIVGNHGGALWEHLSLGSRQTLIRGRCGVFATVRNDGPERLSSVGARVGAGADEVREMRFDELCGRLLIAELNHRKLPVASAVSAGAEVSAAHAVVRIETASGPASLVLVAEQGAWRLDLDTTARLFARGGR